MEPIRQVGFCPHCGNRAPQKHVYTQKYYEKGFEQSGEFTGDYLPSAYYVAVCETCDEILLYHAFLEIEPDTNFVSSDLIWPDPGVLHKSVPKPVSERYERASRVKNIEPNSFAVQIRSALEALCDDRGAKKDSLHNRLKELASRGEIPPVLSEITHVLRLLGNIGAHAGEQSVKPGQVYAIDGFFRAIVEYVYVAPSKLKEFTERNSAKLNHRRTAESLNDHEPLVAALRCFAKH